MAGKGGDFLAGVPGCPGWPGIHSAASLSLVSGSSSLSSHLQWGGGRRRTLASFSEIVGEIYFLIFFNALVVAASSCLRFLSQRSGRTCLKREV